PPRGETGRIHAHERSSQQRVSPVQGNSNTPLYAMCGSAVVLVIGGLIFAFSGSSKPAPRETASHETPPAHPQAAELAPVKATTARSTGTASTVASAPVTPAPTPPAPSRPIESDPETKAS